MLRGMPQYSLLKARISDPNAADSEPMLEVGSSSATSLGGSVAAGAYTAEDDVVRSDPSLVTARGQGK